MKIIFLVWALGILLFPPVGAQSLPEKGERLVSEIMFNGNKVTRKETLLREMVLKPGDVYSDSLRRVCEQRIYNLQLFNHVEIIPIPDHNRVALWVNVTERLYFYPIPVVRLEDRDWSKISYGLGLVHTNFRGLNEYVVTELVFGNRPGYAFQYYNPWIGDRQRYTFGMQVRSYSLKSYYSLLNPISDFNEQRFRARFSLGRYWGLYFSLSASVGYEKITADKQARHLLNNPSGDDVWGMGLTAQYDSRDLKQYPSSGLFVNATLFRLGLFNNANDVNSYQLDMRYYRPLGRFTLAGRLYHSASLGDVPFYQLSYLGFAERIRGHFNDVYEGTRVALAAFEFRFPIVPLFRMSLPPTFMGASATQNLRFGMNGALFLDSGQVWSGERPFDGAAMQTGFGVGLHIRVPYVEVLRLELAFDTQFNHELIIEAKTAL